MYKSSLRQLQALLKEIKQDTGELVVTSTSDLTDVVGDRIESLKVYRANGTFDNYIVESDGSITATITGVSDNFIDSNNNRVKRLFLSLTHPNMEVNLIEMVQLLQVPSLSHLI